MNSPERGSFNPERFVMEQINRELLGLSEGKKVSLMTKENAVVEIEKAGGKYVISSHEGSDTVESVGINNNGELYTSHKNYGAALGVMEAGEAMPAYGEEEELDRAA